MDWGLLRGCFPTRLHILPEGQIRPESNFSQISTLSFPRDGAEPFQDFAFQHRRGSRCKTLRVQFKFIHALCLLGP